MACSRADWKVIAVSGVTNAGKTTLTHRLVQHFPDSVALHQDDFYIPIDDQRHVWVPLPGGRKHQNWEREETIDWLAFEERVREIISRPAAHPQAKRFLILDGHIILNHKPFRDLLDKRFFITLPEDVCADRRSGRTYDPPDPPGYFEAVIWPMYLSNRHAMEKMHSPGDIVYMDGTLKADLLFQQMVSQLASL